jgi:diguanylate cyclase (GGDEF)-like protein/PAS domain S-box-containing protein
LGELDFRFSDRPIPAPAALNMTAPPVSTPAAAISRSAPGRQLSLKARLALWCVLVIAGSLLASSWWMLAQVRRQAVQVLQRSEVQNAQMLARILDQRIRQMMMSLDSGAAAVPVSRLGDGQALLAFMQQRQATATLFAEIVLSDAAGQPLVTRDEQGVRLGGQAGPTRSDIRRVLDSGAPVVAHWVRAARIDASMMYFAVPVLDREKRVRAVLSAGLRLGSRDLLDDLVAGGGLEQVRPRIPSPDLPVTTVLLDRQGVVLAHPDARLLLRPAGSDPGLLAAQAEVVGPQWLVLRLADPQAWFGAFDAAVLKSGWIALCVGLAGGLLLMAWLAWQLRPLERLEGLARRLGQGDAVAEQEWPQARGEIGAVVEALRESVQRRSAVEQHNEQLLRKMRSVLHTAPIGIAFTLQKHFEFVSDEFCSLLGYEPEALKGEPARIVHASQEEYDRLGHRVAEAYAGRGEFAGDLEFVRRDGSHFIGELLGRPVEPGQARAGSIWLLRDVTAERAAHRELAWSATHDPLTGLLNRRALEAELQRLLPQVRAESPAAALFIDLDHFKAVNDSAGHAVGDRLLREVALALAASVRRDELVARLGGDEFVIVLMQCDLDSAVRVADKARAAVERIELQHEDQLLQVGASVGVVPIAPGCSSVAQVMQAADAACYAAKAEGRNRVHADAGPLPGGGAAPAES